MNYILILTVLSILSFVYLKIANKFNIIDKPNHRSSHSIPTIRGGGILFYIAILIYFFISGFQYPYFIMGVSLIALVSFIDDIITLSSNVRLPFQFFAIGLCLYQIGFSIDNFVLILPLLIVGVGFINIYNFMDGINGITGLYSIVSLLALLVINFNENIVDSNLIAYVLLSLIVFGFYNFRKKARMFAGDIGSISIAVLLFFIGLYFIKELKSPLILLLIIVYATDAILTLLYRKVVGEKITEAHRHHIYQKLVDTLKLSHLQVSIIYTILQGIVNVIVYYGYKLKMSFQIIIFCSIILLLTFIYIFLFKKIENFKLKNG